MLAFFVLLPVQYLLIGYDQYGTFAIFIPVYGFLFLPAVATFAGDTQEFLERTAKIQWATMITIYCISHAPALLLLQIPGYEGSNALLLFYLLLIVQLSDVLQYVFGNLFGKTKLAPRVSPSKTVEGLGVLSHRAFFPYLADRLLCVSSHRRCPRAWLKLPHDRNRVHAPGAGAVKFPRILVLAALCGAASVGCAQLSQNYQMTAVTPPQVIPVVDNGRVVGSLGDKWSSAIVGMPVESTHGETLGRVHEVIVDGYGRPGFAIVRYGARVAGLGAKYAAIPWETVAAVLDRERLLLDRSTLENAPTLIDVRAREGDWRGDSERYWRSKIAAAR